MASWIWNGPDKSDKSTVKEDTPIIKPHVWAKNWSIATPTVIDWAAFSRLSGYIATLSLARAADRDAARLLAAYEDLQGRGDDLPNAADGPIYTTSQDVGSDYEHEPMTTLVVPGGSKKRGGRRHRPKSAQEAAGSSRLEELSGQLRGQVSGQFTEQLRKLFKGHLKGYFEGRLRGIHVRGQLGGDSEDNSEGNSKGSSEGNSVGNLENNAEGNSEGNSRRTTLGGQVRGQLSEGIPEDNSLSNAQDSASLACLSHRHFPAKRQTIRTANSAMSKTSLANNLRSSLVAIRTKH